MGKILLRLIFLVLIVSCAGNRDKEIYKGKLDELIVGDFILEKDSLTRWFIDLKGINETGNHNIVYWRSARKFEGWGIVFVNTRTGKEERVVEIPMEGPNSMKGGVSGVFVHDRNTILLINNLGNIGIYDSLGQQNAYVNSELDISYSIDKMMFLEFRNGLSYYDHPYLYFGQNPSHVINFRENPGPGKLRSEFALDFKEWLYRTDVVTGKVQSSNFLIPEGYEVFHHDATSTFLFGAYDSNRDVNLLCWPYSNEVYELEGLSLSQKVIPESSLEFKFMPSEPKAVRSATVTVQPKNASKHIFLIYDSYRDLLIRCSKIKESGESTSKFERIKHYVLSIYSGEWEPKGEYLFDFETSLEVENWFLTSEGLFINKPEQESEDEYGFYKIDLSRFSD